jgi:hypothetical protein
MTRKLSATEVKVTLANMARMAPDDLDGYVIVLCQGDDVHSIMTNTADEATTIAMLARAIEHRSRAVGVLEDHIKKAGGTIGV